MPMLTAQDVEAMLRGEPIQFFRIQGPQDSTDSRYLGQVGVHKTWPKFRYGYWFNLHPTSHFRIIPIQIPDRGVDGGAVIFHQFDHSETQTEPSEMFAGWVRREDLPAAESWVEDMNARIAAHLSAKDPAA